MRNQGAEVNELRAPLDVRQEIERTDIDEEPVYYCDLTDIVLKHINWQHLLPRVEPFYAVKCNDSPMVLGLLAALGTSFDCASKAEIKSVKDLGVSSERIIFANPTKPVSHLNAAIGYGIRKMTFDCAIELYKIQKIYPDAHLVLRIRCDAKVAQCPLGDKFGCDPVNDAPGLLVLAKELGLLVIGISFHVGSGCMDPPVYAKAIYTAKSLFRFAENLGYRFSLLDIGGGFPGDKDTDLVELSKIINSSLEQHFPEAGAGADGGAGVQVIAEPGRYYVSSAYTLVTKVHSKREIRDLDVGGIKTHMYFINDGVYGSFNCNIYDHKVVVPVPVKSFHGPLYDTTIWGPTCDALDQVCTNVLMPDMQIDDLIMFENMGAYTIPIASPFNGFPLPILKYYIEPAVVYSLGKTSLDMFVKSIL